MHKKEYSLHPNEITYFYDGSVGMHFDNLDDIYDETDSPQEWSYCPHDDPQLETEVKIDFRVKCDLVREALTNFFEEDVVEYVQKYIEKHAPIDRIEEMDLEYKQADRDEARLSRLESQYDDY